MTTETGSLGSTSEELVGLAERSVWNLLRHLGMLEGEPSPAPAIVWLELVNYVIPTPRVSEGEPLAMVSRVAGDD